MASNSDGARKAVEYAGQRVDEAGGETHQTAERATMC